MTAACVLIVDDEDAIRFAVRDFLEMCGYRVDEAATCADAEKRVRAGGVDAVILDFRLPDGDALDLLPKIKAADATIPVIVLTAHASIDRAVRAIQGGAEQFLTKPVELPALRVILQRSLENQRIRRKEAAQKSRTDRDEIDPFLGTSSAIRNLEAQARRSLETESPVLIQGSRLRRGGSRALATQLGAVRRSVRRSGLRARAGASNRRLLATGARLTGAVSSKPAFEVAHHGTLFLDRSAT
jgi:DNA-binding NtrC family response regulator